jgi:hypothetical protein
MASAYVSNLVINAGVDFEQVFTLEDGANNAPINLTDYGLSAQMRKHATATGVTTFTTSFYDAPNGKIQIGLSTAQTASLKPGRYVYDVVITNTNNKMERVVEGMVLVSPGVTR